MSENEIMSRAFTCKKCLCFDYACKCEKFESLEPEAYDYYCTDDSDEYIEEDGSINEEKVKEYLANKKKD